LRAFRERLAGLATRGTGCPDAAGTR
jgi:hypothetical protein